MIILTGARGFIGSVLLKKLNNEGYENIILVDELENSAKDYTLKNLKYIELIDRAFFVDWLKKNKEKIEVVFHLGARTDTTETDKSIFDELNLNYSKTLFEYCVEYKIPFIYASSAATYGDGAFGYNDEQSIRNLQPLNEYGWSKQNFDLWVNEQSKKPPFWAGMKFFNVYGPHENHKGRMASVVYHAYHQIKKTGKMKLFQSHHSNFKDGEQQRDFIFVEDVVNICLFLFKNKVESGIYNAGSGQARTFLDLVKAVFHNLDIEPKIEFIPTPEDIRDKYQYFTEASMSKLINQGFQNEFHTLEKGVEKYIDWLQKQ